MDSTIAEIARLRADLEHRPLSPLLKCFSFFAGLAARDIAAMNDDQLVAAQKPFPRNFFTTLVAGRRAKGVRVTDEMIPTPHGEVLGRMFTPARKTGGGLLYLHGGGWVSGDPGIVEWWCSHVAARTGTVVVALRYRLAPRHRFPAGLQDCHHALNWMREHSERLGIDTAKIGVAGDSAGGNLAAALCLISQHQGGPAIAHQILIYPALDLTFRSPSMEENSEAPLLTAANTRAYGRHYLVSASPADPLASPLLAADLSNMPPALIQVAEHDPLRDDGWRHAIRLRQAGVPVCITEYAGAPHGFTSLPGLTPLAAKALDETCEFLSQTALL